MVEYGTVNPALLDFRRRTSTPFVRLIVFLSSCALPGLAAAQNLPAPQGEAAADPKREEVEEILIQGQAGQGIESGATVSVTAFDAADLEAMGVSDVSDIAQFTPNLEIRTAGSTTPTFFIRGVGLNDFTANASGSVAIYQDDVAMNLPAIQLGQIYDVESTEILRGPQGSGAGRNASAGAIKVYSNKPNGSYEGFARVDYGRFNYVDSEGALEVPLYGDIVSGRFAFRLTQRNGIVSNRCAGAAPIEERFPGGIIPLVLAPAPPTFPDPRPQFNEDGTPTMIGVGTYAPHCNESDKNVSLWPNPGTYLAAGEAEKLNDIDMWAARGQFRIVPPSGNSDWLLNVHGSRVNQLATVGQNIGTFDATPYYGSRMNNPDYIQPEVRNEFEEIKNRCGGTFAGSTGLDFGCGVQGHVGPAPKRRDFPSQAAFLAARAARIAARTAYIDESRGIISTRLNDRPLDRKPFEGDYNRTGWEKQDTYGGYLRGEWEFNTMSLTSISAYEAYDRTRFVDADYSPDTVFEFDIQDEAWQFSQELDLNGELSDEPVAWATGVYFLAETLDYLSKTLSSPSTDVRGFVGEYRQDTLSLGIYADFEWQFLDDFTLSGGVRYNLEHKSFDAKQIDLGASDRCGDEDNPPLLDCQTESTKMSPTGTLTLEYAFNEEVSTYWKYSHGWKAQQYSIASGLSVNSHYFAEPEEIDAFEIGFRSTWFDGRLHLRGAVFWYDYRNYQVFLFTNDYGSAPVRIVTNASEAQLYGAEIDFVLEPIDRLVAEIRFGWLEGEFNRFVDTGTKRITTSIDPPFIQDYEINLDYTGNRLPNAPEFKVSGSLSYTLEMGRFGSLTPRYDFTWTDDDFFDPSEGRGAPSNFGDIYLPAYAVGQEAFWLHHLRLSYLVPGDRIEVSGWVRNLTDEVYKSGAFDASSSVGMIGYRVGDPRTYGGSVRVEF